MSGAVSGTLRKLLMVVVTMSILGSASYLDQVENNGIVSPRESTVERHHWPIPTRTINGIPIYESFEELQPAFELNDGTVYVINFWATWCKPCVEELPHFEELTKKYESSKVKVVLCSLDFPKQIESKLIPFLDDRNLQSHVIVLLDGKFNDWLGEVSEDWSGTIPATYIYLKDEHSFYEKAFSNMQELEEAVKPLLL